MSPLTPMQRRWALKSPDPLLWTSLLHLSIYTISLTTVDPFTLNSRTPANFPWPLALVVSFPNPLALKGKSVFGTVLGGANLI